MPASRTLCVACLALALAASAPVATAEVVRIEIRDRRPFAAGYAFEPAGPYERITGRLFLEVDPDAPANARICDLERAPQNARGRVECWTDFCLLAPADPRRGNRRLLYDVTNRGNQLAVWTLNSPTARTNDPETLVHAGNAFLMRQGYAVLATGWNGDVIDDGTGRLLAGLPEPVAEGRPITGPVHLEFCVAEPTPSRAFSWSPWGVFAAYPPAVPDHRQATLTVRPRRDAPAETVPHDAWGFGRVESGTVVPSETDLFVKGGLQPGLLYDLVYTARQPRVTGLGLASVRDAISCFLHGPAAESDSENPLAGAVDAAYGFGISQSGRFLHQFFHDGFNTDEAGRPVFAAAILHVAGAGKGAFNHRFRMGTDYGSQHEGHLAASEFFPFAPVPQTDPVTGASGDTLARCRAAGHVPRLMFVHTATEYWNRAGSLLHTDVAGTTDLELPPEVRVYLVAGAQHLGGGPADPGHCRQPRNVLDDRGPVLRALLTALDEWVTNGTAPPPSRHPRVADGTLVDVAEFRARFPRIPGVELPAGCYRPPRLDFGPRFHTEGIADVVPPRTGPPYHTLVPAVDADGNETAGIRLPDVAVPLGTFTGWNLRAARAGAPGMLAPLDGMFLPFAATRAERLASGDPRPAVQERYPTREAYLARVAEAALALQAERFLLAEDVTRILRTAAARDLWPAARAAAAAVPAVGPGADHSPARRNVTVSWPELSPSWVQSSRHRK